MTLFLSLFFHFCVTLKSGFLQKPIKIPTDFEKNGQKRGQKMGPKMGQKGSFLGPSTGHSRLDFFCLKT